ncbi:glycosyltransferase family 9 protein [Rhodovibrio salinarum]|uniref:Glycosyltransferase family 9 protein n=2 Tax=Rhodovibrio salinarum TaxID=1087 RepID=A0A934QL81_9PROT|nr:glycosyltransferase family 9 protein [Rhodovibrio salinarum]MBK1698580.1 glycosyltransferase family 9 protein [Rhodovibrio salinarum]
MASPDRILVIKHSALGDFVLATASFQAIRRAHPDAHIVLLTTKPYVSLGEASGLFDAVWTDPRASLKRPGALFGLIGRVRQGLFDRVYDLQRSQRTRLYFTLLRLTLLGRRPPEWVGPAPGASHRTTGHTDRRHIAEREASQLRAVGIEVGAPDLSFLDSDLQPFDLPARIALLVPGGAPHRPAKRWPAINFAELGRYLAGQGITPVLIGTQAEAREIAQIREACPAARDLHGRTSFADLAALGRRAEVTVGNDTGPMHVIAAAGGACVVLFSHESDPERISPRGPWVAIRRKPSLQDLPVEEVIAALPQATTGEHKPGQTFS